MSGSQQVIPQPGWQILWNGGAVSKDLSATVTEVSYEEEVGKKANHIELKIDDSLRRWQKTDEADLIGSLITLSIGYVGAPLVPAGTFQFDEYGIEGPPDTFIVRAIQAPISVPIRTRNQVAYENTTLSRIAGTVAARHGLTVVADAVTPDVIFQRVTQGHEEDLAFLHRIANEHNYELQVRNNQLIFFSRVGLETAPITAAPIMRTDLTRFRLLNTSLSGRTYCGCQVSYFDPTTKTLVTATATDPSVKTADTLKVVARAENAQQAAAKAAAHLHRHNKKKCTSELTMPGTMSYRAGQRVQLQGWGDFDKNVYLVQSGKHRLTRQGYETELHLETNVVQAGSGMVQDIVSDEEK